MAQNITLLGASYSAVPAVTLPKTGGGTAEFYDVSDTTATASDVASGKYFYTAAGVKTEGTASGGGGGGGTITQDANGYLVLSPDGGTPTPGGGLEYEEGTIVPTTDSMSVTITFSNTHTSAPFFAMLQDTSHTDTDLASTNSLLIFAAMNFSGLYGTVPYAANTFLYGRTLYFYKTSSGQSSTGGQKTSANAIAAVMSSSGMTFDTTTYHYRVDTTYKWIAVWPPTI